MAQHKSAKRRARASRRRAARNAAWKSKMRTAIKRIRSAKEKTKAAAELNRTVKLLDQLAARGIIHRNQAANRKSRLTKFVNSLK